MTAQPRPAPKPADPSAGPAKERPPQEALGPSNPRKKQRSITDRPSSVLQAQPVSPGALGRSAWRGWLSFAVLVIAPLIVAAGYLWNAAVPQFESNAGFSVRREEAPSPVDLFGGFAGVSGSNTSDADVLYAFIQSQELVEMVDADLDLRTLFGRHHAQDPVFAFDPDGTIEDLVHYWRRMVRVTYDAGTGLIDLRVRAFEPSEAQAIATAIVAASTQLVNGLSAEARRDATAFAAAELDEATRALRSARAALTEFRVRTQIVDPTADVQGQMGLLASLEGQLAEELIRLDLLRGQSQAGDPRILRSEERITVIEDRIADERTNLGARPGSASGPDFASLVAEYERLSVELTFAEEEYTAARASEAQARAEARRTTRYLAAHVRPTLAQRSTAPDPVLIVGLGAIFLTLGWAVMALVWVSARDRR
ncbi:MAG: hypothetical protein AAFR35_06955 [Pseudomonadota bacterium]